MKTSALTEALDILYIDVRTTRIYVLRVVQIFTCKIIMLRTYRVASEKPCIMYICETLHVTKGARGSVVA
jgi:hypothetical protein